MEPIKSQTPMRRLTRLLTEWYAMTLRIIIYAAIQIFMVGLLFGGAYLTTITLLNDFDVCITLTLSVSMFILGGVMIHHWIRDVMKE